jgi:hypothetical protein
MWRRLRWTERGVVSVEVARRGVVPTTVESELVDSTTELMRRRQDIQAGDPAQIERILDVALDGLRASS